MRKLNGVRIPASTSNMGPGFDCLGCALKLYLQVRVNSGEAAHRVEAFGVDSDKMPSGTDNLILKVFERVVERRKKQVGPVTFRVENEIPLARGLGSSATAILAGISCYEIVSEDRLTDDEILDYAWEFEPHSDNIVASLSGGLTIPATVGAPKPVFLRLEVPEGVSPVLVIPDFEVSTRSAREVLPDSYSKSDLVFNVQRSALAVGALATGRWELLGEAMRDRVHQPYRSGLVPGLEQVLALKAEGLYGIALSGAGPTVLALTAPEKKEDIGRRVAEVFSTHGVSARVQATEIDTEGRRFLE